MYEPIKVAFGKFLGRYFADLVPTTLAMREYCSRQYKEAVMMAPARMVDAAEEMMLKYFRVEDEKLVPTHPHKLPVIIAAIAKDTTPTGRDYTRQIADKQWFQFPGDPKQRIFAVRTSAVDLRAQIAVFAYDEPTARSMIGQLLLFLDETESRRFYSTYSFAGFDSQWAVQIESPDSPAMSIATDAKNLTILTVDLTLKCDVPLFYAPKEGEENDGKGTPGTDDPAGYPYIKEITENFYETASLIRSVTLEGENQ